VAGNLQVKEVRIDDTDDRFVICYNPMPPPATRPPELASSPSFRK
jgi:hypothetical protein